MVTAYQLSAVPDLVPDTLVKFGRTRFAVTTAVVENDTGFCVEVRLGRRLIARNVIGPAREDFAARLSAAMEKAASQGRLALLEALHVET
jgi:hypothetical protein